MCHETSQKTDRFLLVILANGILFPVNVYELTLPNAEQEALLFKIGIIDRFYSVFFRNIADPVRTYLYAHLILDVFNVASAKPGAALHFRRFSVEGKRHGDMGIQSVIEQDAVCASRHYQEKEQNPY